VRSRLAAVLVSAMALSGWAVVNAPQSAAAAPTEAPIIHPATFDSASPNPILGWDSVPGASKYHVQISDSPSFGSLLYQADTVGLQVTPDKNLPLATLYWRVAAEDATGHAGPYSSTDTDQGTFKTTWDRSPDLVSPADGKVLNFPNDPAVFTWAPLSGAKSYELQVDDSPDFVGAQDFKTTSTSYVLAEPQTINQTYYWRVRGISVDSSIVSQWNPLPTDPQRSYTYSWTGVPTDLRSTTQRVDADHPAIPQLSDVTLTWTPAAGASKYEIQVSPNRDFTNNVTVDAVVDGAAYTPEPTLNNTSYYWRVRAIDAAASPHNGTWSEVQTFTRVASPAPELVSPQPASGNPGDVADVLDTPTLKWTPVDHSAYYELQVSANDPSFTNLSTTFSCITNHTEWTPLLSSTGGTAPGSCTLDSMTWASGNTYYWRVRGVDVPSGVLGIWSSASNGAFRIVRTLAGPTYEQPANGATVSVPSLSWDAVPGALSYRVTVLNSNNSPVVDGVTTYATSYTPTTALTAGTYSWYVQSVDVTNSVSGVAVGGARTFTLGGSPATAANPNPTSATNPVAVRMPALAWDAVASATKYTVRYSVNGISQGTLIPSTVYPAYTPTSAPLAPGTYSWTVDAYNGTTLLSSSTTSADFTITTVASADKATFDTWYQTPHADPSDTTSPATDVRCTGGVCGDTPTFTWTAVPDATSYAVTVSYDKDFTNIARTYTTRYTTLTPRDSYLDSQAGQAYYWFVSPCVNFPSPSHTACAAGAQDPVANAGAPSFKKRSNGVSLCPLDDTSSSDPALCPLSQSDPDPNRQLTLSWADYLKSSTTPTDGSGGAADPASQEAKQYRLQVSNVADFSTLLDTQVVDGTSYTPTVHTYPVGPLWWRVQAIDNSGNSLTWSAPATVTRTLPAPVQNPTTDPVTHSSTVGGAPLLTWQPSAFAAKYNVEIYPDTTFTPQAKIAGASGSSKFAAFTPSSSLAPGTYAWRVQAVDADGKVGPWYTDSIHTTDPSVDKAPFTFTIGTSAPTLQSPRDGVHLNSGNVLFRWGPVSQATQYQWQLSPTILFGAGTISQKTVMTAWSPQSPFADGLWYWRVQALDAAGNVLASSDLNSLTKDATPPTVTALSPTSSLAVDGSISATFSENVTNVTAAAVRVVPSTGGSALAGTVVSTGMTAVWTPSQPLVPGQTYTVSFTSTPVDAFGNALVPRSWAIRTSTQVENTSPALVEHWDRDSASAALGGTYDSSNAKGSSATYHFTGTSISLLGARMKTGGYAAVYLDGVKQSSTVSFYNGTTQYRRVVWSKSGLPAGSHTVLVSVLGTKPGAATDHWVYVDGFQTGSTQVDQSNAAVHEAFGRLTKSGTSGGSYDTITHATSGDTSSRPSYNLTFRGTGISVYGVRSPSSGKAAVYVDGKLKSTVDLRSTSTVTASLASVSGLADKVHTLRIDVVGTKTGTGSSVGIDYLRIV
jgi:hypothetical protein